MLRSKTRLVSVILPSWYPGCCWCCCLDRRRSCQAGPRSAIALLVEHGFGGTTIEAIAARSGTAKTTVYRHWSDKDSDQELIASLLLGPLFYRRLLSREPLTDAFIDQVSDTVLSTFRRSRR